MAQPRKKWKAVPGRKYPSEPRAQAPIFSTSGLRVLLSVAALWVLTLAAYSNSFRAGLVYDNTSILLKDPWVRAVTGENLRLILTNEYWYPPTGNGLYRFSADHALLYLFNYAGLGNGGDPTAYHVVNYLLHSANATLVFLLLRLLLRDGRTAFAGAALWAVHPLLTESVTNVVGRADLLAAFGVDGGTTVFRARRSGKWLSALAMAALERRSQQVSVFFPRRAALWLAGRRGAVRFRFPAHKCVRRERAAGYAAIGLPCLLYLGARYFRCWPRRPPCSFHSPIIRQQVPDSGGAADCCQSDRQRICACVMARAPFLRLLL